MPAATRWGHLSSPRDAASGALWSAGVQHVPAALGHHSAVFSEHQACFIHRAGPLTTTTKIVVSAEDDAGARRVTLTNTGRHAREVDLTSYANWFWQLWPPISCIRRFPKCSSSPITCRNLT